jgi:hypothetical protein
LGSLNRAKLDAAWRQAMQNPAFREKYGKYDQPSWEREREEREHGQHGSTTSGESLEAQE